MMDAHSQRHDSPMAGPSQDSPVDRDGRTVTPGNPFRRKPMPSIQNPFPVDPRLLQSPASGHNSMPQPWPTVYIPSSPSPTVYNANFTSAPSSVPIDPQYLRGWPVNQTPISQPWPTVYSPSPQYSSGFVYEVEESPENIHNAASDIRKSKMPMRSNSVESRPPPYSERPIDPFIHPTPALLAEVRKLNILILGETGVGKSTFINAFVNYLTYQSLDEALNMQDVACVIPSSFTWQSLEDGDYIAKHIKVAPNTGDHNDAKALRDETDGTGGQSATQRTKIHRVNVGNTEVSLFDTPGIGDTRGNEQDKKNMDDILDKLRAVKELHGILILLKPNNARLNVMFTFCLKELLIHLHRDAAKNIVFGFTNSRNTSFRPGETYSILKHMLDEDPSVGIKLSRNNSFCFDSESFRCLAAYKNGVNIHDMGDIEDYRISWDKSKAEAWRMLEHLRSIAPHLVESTWNLHRTREVVRILTIPMADITQNINNNIALLKDEQNTLNDKMQRGHKLKADLHLTKIVYEMKELDMPRTVCSAKECIEYKNDKKHYKSVCHNPCYLTNVEVEQIQCQQLLKCWAFSGGANENCRVCGHRWEVHLHVLWEPVEKLIKVEDEAIARRIRENADDVELARTAIRSRQRRIGQYEKERAVIQKAAGQFSVYLKRSSIKPYNDSKLAYLDHLVEDEKAKIQAGGSEKRLRDLLSDRKQHEEEVRTLLEYARIGENDKLLDQEGINREIMKLYSLKLTGQTLQKVALQLRNIEEATRVEGRGSSRQGGGSASVQHIHTRPNALRKVNRQPSRLGFSKLLKSIRDL